MRITTVATLAVITFLAVSTVYANAQMYSSGSLYDKHSPVSNQFKERMQKQMDGLFVLQYEHDRGMITQEQYRLGMEARCQEMTAIQREYLSSGVAGILH
jgi:hypothetical protein